MVMGHNHPLHPSHLGIVEPHIVNRSTRLLEDHIAGLIQRDRHLGFAIHHDLLMPLKRFSQRGNLL